MVNHVLLYNKIVSLPAELVQEVDDFVDFVLQKKRERNEEIKNDIDEIPQHGFGSMKGKIWMSPDFDEPLEDFKDYM